MNEENYLMWLSRIEGLGIKRRQLLLDMFKSAQDIFHAPRRLLNSVRGLNEITINKIAASQNIDTIHSYVEELENKNIRFISKYHKDYPSLLTQIPDPPTVIYVLGTIPDNDLPKVSIIGSRRCSEYGLTTSQRLSRELAANGIVIVSGMARGIDSMAHKGALDGGGLTIAVLGCGVDICYPAENRALREKIIANGCLISEYPPKTNPMPAFFPARNRIISGLSLATLVVEAAKKSGTLITVEQALEQGRDVYAVPGNITSRLSEGTNDLIKEGAALVSSSKDVLDALGLSPSEDNIESANHTRKESLEPEEKLIYACINFEPIAVDEIINKSKSQVYTVNYILTLLELKGYIQKLPGQRYIRL